MFEIVKGFEFEACHKLYLTYDSPCTNLHGHSYKVELKIKSSYLDENGMVMDFSELNKVKDWVMENWDHTTIIPSIELSSEMEAMFGKTYAFPETNVSAEYMCKFLHDKACQLLHKTGSQVEVKIYETSNNYAKYSE